MRHTCPYVSFRLAPRLAKDHEGRESVLVSIQRLRPAIMPRLRFAVPNLPQCHFFLLLLLAPFTGPQFGLGQDNRLVKFEPGRRQLFLDDFAISRVKNLTRTLHQPEKRGAVITPQRPWEKYVVQTRSVPAWDEERNVFQLWVNAIDREPDFMAGPTYFESKDGIHWKRPILRQFEYGGSRENNILAFDPVRDRLQGTCQNRPEFIEQVPRAAGEVRERSRSDGDCWLAQSPAACR